MLLSTSKVMIFVRSFILIYICPIHVFKVNFIYYYNHFFHETYYNFTIAIINSHDSIRVLNEYKLK